MVGRKFAYHLNNTKMETQTITKTKWNLDPTHSELGFKVKHMMITNVSGSFEKFDVNVETEGSDFSFAKINFTADTDSISTGNADRDNHLKTADFFENNFFFFFFKKKKTVFQTNACAIPRAAA